MNFNETSKLLKIFAIISCFNQIYHFYTKHIKQYFLLFVKSLILKNFLKICLKNCQTQEKT